MDQALASTPLERHQAFADYRQSDTQVARRCRQASTCRYALKGAQFIQVIQHIINRGLIIN